VGAALSALAAVTPGDDGWIGNWSPGIGDPNVMGWVTVAAYLVAAAACFRVYRARTLARAGKTPLPLVFAALLVSPQRLGRIPAPARERALWLALAIVLLLLGINKQLDLQTALTEMARLIAYEQGWYQDRRGVQLAFIVVVALVGVWLVYAVRRLADGCGPHMRAVLAGAVLLACFVTIRAASFHHIDRLLGTHLLGFKLNWIFELGGIAFVTTGALRAGRLKPQPAPAT
jgi:hypothetical protein